MKRLGLILFLVAACGSVPMTMPPATATTPVSAVPLSDTLTAPGLSAPVDVVRDEWGIPHIYGASFPDVSYAEGYYMAEDRMFQLDILRHFAEGTLSELLGDVAPQVIDTDLQQRLYHRAATAKAGLDLLKASTDPDDQVLLAALDSFSTGVNAYLTDLNGGKYTQPPQLAFLYDPRTVKPWTAVDTASLGLLLAFQLSYDSNTEINLSAVEAAAAAQFDMSTDAARSARKGIAKDLEILAPVDPTFTLSTGWTGMNGDTTTASLGAADPGILALLDADRPSVMNVGKDRLLHPSIGSNNWIIGPALSATGHTLVANDTHLALGNPPTFYLVHLAVSGGSRPGEVMGVQFPGVPGVILGMNQHIAWGATVNNIDVTDVYKETIVTCDGSTSPCVMFKGTKVPLVARMESFGVGRFGKVSHTITQTYWEVPHHGPLIPRIARHAFEALGSTELSVRYTGLEPAQLIRAVYGLDTAKSMKEAVAALDRDFKYGGQNWVIGDDQGNFGWTQTVRVPRRAAGFAPWKVMPGDGSAEWGPDMDPKYIPHAYNPAQGFLATANADPIGVTSDGDPFFDEPVVDGSPLYLGADYDAGTRVGRITKRIKALSAAGKKLTLDDLQSIQADAVSEYGQYFAPTLLDAASALQKEIAHAGSVPELTGLVGSASAQSKMLVPPAQAALVGWSFDSPSAVESEQPTPAQVADSLAALITAAWTGYFQQRALGDELKVLGRSPGADSLRKLLVRMCLHPEMLATGTSPATKDALLFDDLTTTTVTESKRYIAARALLDALGTRLGGDAGKWRWGQVHTLALDFNLPMDSLRIPPPTDPNFPNGFPRHGGVGTVDVGDFGLSTVDFSYTEGPAIRFVCELDPQNGPRARNALPGGQVFDPGSPHYRDQMELWRKNQTFDLAFRTADVLTSAMKEYQKNMNGRVRFTPAGGR